MKNDVQNLSTEKKKDNLAIASLIVSIVAIAGSWIPILNVISMVIAIIGIILSVWSLIRAIKNKFSIGMPISGIIVSLFSIFLIFSMYTNSGTSKKVSSSANQSSSSSSSSSENKSNSNESETEEKDEYNVGDTIDFDGKRLLLQKLKGITAQNQFSTLNRVMNS